MGLMLGTGSWNAYASTAPGEAQQVRNEAGTSRVTGTVLDENGEPVIGASVRVLGTDISVPTDIDGKFNIAGLKPNQTIEVSYVGYVTKSLKVSELENKGGSDHPRTYC